MMPQYRKESRKNTSIAKVVSLFPEVVVIWSVVRQAGSSRLVKACVVTWLARVEWWGKYAEKESHLVHRRVLTEQGSFRSFRTEINRKRAAFILFVKLLLGIIAS